MGNKTSKQHSSDDDTASDNCEDSDNTDDGNNENKIFKSKLLDNLTKERIVRSATFNAVIAGNKVSSQCIDNNRYHLNESNKVSMCYVKWNKFCLNKSHKLLSRFFFKIEYDTELINKRDHEFINIMMMIEMDKNSMFKQLPYDIAHLIFKYLGRSWSIDDNKYFGWNFLTNINTFKSINVSYIFTDYQWYFKILDKIIIYMEGDDTNKIKLDTNTNDLFQYTLLLIPPTIYCDYEGGDLFIDSNLIPKCNKLWTWTLFHKSVPYKINKIEGGCMIIMKFDVAIVAHQVSF